MIELLVVITIIVVLLALLTPALDKAVEAAERVRCGANLDVWGIGLAQHALDHRNRVMVAPKHGITQDPNGWVYPNHPRFRRPAADGNEAGQFNLDDIAPYVQGGTQGGRATSVGEAWYCPSSRESFWYKGEHDRAARDETGVFGINLPFMFNDYAYFGHGGTTLAAFATHPDKLIGGRLEGGKLLMADTIYRWNSGEGQWWFNHSTVGWSMHDNWGNPIYRGDPPLTGTSQLFGDGSVHWKDGSQFDPIGMNARRLNDDDVQFVSESSDGAKPTSGGSMNFY